jgi:hypothetical protein
VVVEQCLQHRQIFLHMARRMGIGQAHDVLDRGTVGQPNAEDEAAARGGIGGHGLLGHSDRVARVGRHDRRPQCNARSRAARQRHHQERVVIPCGQVGQPEARKPGGFGLLRLRDEGVQRVRFAGATGKNAESHSDSFLGEVCEMQGRPPALPSGIRRPVHEHILTMIYDDHNLVFLQE